MNFADYFTKLSFPLIGLVRLPELSIPAATKGNKIYLKRLVWDGYLDKRKRGKFDGIAERDVIERLAFEFSVFEKTGIVDYLLLVWDILKWCDDNKIPRGPGRGSVTGSLAAYCCDIVKVNALRHNLNFTRFISEARAKPQIIDGALYASGKSLCDIDCDISYSQRDKVLTYIDQKYPGRVAKIANRLELTGKTALKDVLKIYLGYNDIDAQYISGNIDTKFGKVESLSEAIEKHPELKTWMDSNPLHKEAVELAISIEGTSVGKGVHASGIYIGYHPVDGHMPVECAKNGEIVTSYDMNVVAELGVKLDALCLKTLDTIHETCELVGIKMDDIDVNDPSIYAYLASTDRLYGLFQIEEGLTKEVIKKVHPRNIDDLACCLSVSRPGSLVEIPTLIKYVKTGAKKIIHPLFDEILAPTGGIILYQESINEICQKVYKMAATDADEVRRAISKKIREDMAKWEPVLYKQGEIHGIPKEITKYFWDTCNASSDYLFSANHCYAYSYITAHTVFLKANYPKEFFLSLFRMARHETDSQVCIATIMQEATAIGLKVLPPDIIHSEPDFSIDKEGNIRFGINHIRGINDTTMAKMVTFKQQTFETKFKVFEAASSAKIPVNVLGTLISSGCLTWKSTSRVKLTLESQLYNLLTEREKPLVHKLAADYDEDLLVMLKDMPNRKDEKGKPLIRESRLETLRRDYAPYWAMYQQNAQNEELTAYLMERTLLGFSYSATLHGCYSKKVVGLTRIADLLVAGEKVKLAKEEADRKVAETGAVLAKGKRERGRVFKCVCFVEEPKLNRSRSNGTPYLKLTLADDSSSCRAMCYGQERLDSCKSFNGELPTDGALVIATGTLSSDGSLLFLDSLITQPSPVAFKRSDAEPTI